jgi:hypothetical protein
MDFILIWENSISMKLMNSTKPFFIKGISAGTKHPKTAKGAEEVLRASNLHLPPGVQCSLNY